MNYTNKVIERFKSPKHMGELKEANGKGKVGNPVCGDVMEVAIKVENNIIVDAKVKTFGCVAAISTSDVVCELAIGKTIGDAEQITKADVVSKLEDLPPEKIHCSSLGLDALKKAISAYKEKH